MRKTQYLSGIKRPFVLSRLLPSNLPTDSLSNSIDWYWYSWRMDDNVRELPFPTPEFDLFGNR